MSNTRVRIKALRAEIKRLEEEVDRAWQQVRVLKAREDRRYADLAFSDTSRELLKRIEDALADLEFTANPRQAIPLRRESVSKGKLSETPIPGLATRRDRERLEEMQRRLQRVLVWYEQEQENDLLGRKRVYVPRPRCQVCGDRGQVGWTHCPKGHGPYEQEGE